MSEREDVEALAEAVSAAPICIGWTSGWCRNLAESLLASSWLAARDEAVRASERVRLAGEVDAAREAIRVEMLAQPMTDGRDTYSDGYQQGLARAIDRIDAALHPVPGVRLTEEE